MKAMIKDLIAQAKALEATHRKPRPLRPRSHADRIISLPESEREQALAELPAEIQPTVRHYVIDHYRKLDGLVRMVLNAGNREARKQALTIVPECVRLEVRRRVVDEFERRSARSGGAQCYADFVSSNLFSPSDVVDKLP